MRDIIVLYRANEVRFKIMVPDPFISEIVTVEMDPEQATRCSVEFRRLTTT